MSSAGTSGRTGWTSSEQTSDFRLTIPQASQVLASLEKLVVRFFPRGARQLFGRFRARDGGCGGPDRGVPFAGGFGRRPLLLTIDLGLRIARLERQRRGRLWCHARQRLEAGWLECLRPPSRLV